MALFTLGKEHEGAFKEILDQADAWNSQKALQSALYVLSAIPTVRLNWNKVFNVQGKYLMPNALYKLNLSKGEQILYALAANLYNGTEFEECSLAPDSIMGVLDHQYRLLYMQALQYRFLFDEVPLRVRLAV